MKFDKKTMIRLLEHQGLRYVKGRNHLKFVAPGGQIFVIPSTPGRGRAFANTEAQLRKYGFSLTVPKVGSVRARNGRADGHSS